MRGQLWKDGEPMSSHDFYTEPLPGWTYPRHFFSCRKCRRDFVTEERTDRLWAVNRERAELDAGVSRRWTSERCSGGVVAADDDDRRAVA